jgi:Trk-type K+ transport system membrane component
MAVVSVVLMGIGVIIMGGFGFGILLDGINQIS